jgi:hypothetical protein
VNKPQYRPYHPIKRVLTSTFNPQRRARFVQPRQESFVHAKPRSRSLNTDVSRRLVIDGGIGGTQPLPYVFDCVYLRKLTRSEAAFVRTELVSVPSLRVFLHFLDMVGRARYDLCPEALIQILDRCLARCDLRLDMRDLRLAETF